MVSTSEENIPIQTPLRTAWLFQTRR